MKHEGSCITTEQLKKWREENNIGALDKAGQMANMCPLCKRIWMRYWASQPTVKAK